MNSCVVNVKFLELHKYFPFGLKNNQEVSNIIQTDSMKALENLPSYEITSQATNVDSRKQSDIDENIVNYLNSRYHSAHEFQSLKKDNSFNIFHSNLHGHESKFYLQCNFVNNTKMDLDIICISETAQKLNQSYDTNITLDGYKYPYTTCSKFHKGGVAIYIGISLIYNKDKINVSKREDALLRGNLD